MQIRVHEWTKVPELNRKIAELFAKGAKVVYFLDDDLGWHMYTPEGGAIPLEADVEDYPRGVDPKKCIEDEYDAQILLGCFEIPENGPQPRYLPRFL